MKTRTLFRRCGAIVRKNEDCGTPGNANLLIGGVGVSKKTAGLLRKGRFRGHRLAQPWLPAPFRKPAGDTARDISSRRQPASSDSRTARERGPTPSGRYVAGGVSQAARAWIDAGHGSCALQEPAIGYAVQAALLSFDRQRYRMFAWVVMPNHVHALFEPASLDRCENCGVVEEIHRAQDPRATQGNGRPINQPDLASGVLGPIYS